MKPIHLYINDEYLRTDIVSEDVAHGNSYSIALGYFSTGIRVVSFKLNYIAIHSMASENFVVLGVYSNDDFKWEDNKLCYLGKEVEIK